MKNLIASLVMVAFVVSDAAAQNRQDPREAWGSKDVREVQADPRYAEQQKDLAIANYLTQKAAVENYSSGLWMHPEIQRQIQIPSVVQKAWDNAQIQRRR